MEDRKILAAILDSLSSIFGLRVSAVSLFLKDDLLLSRLEIVVIPEPLAGHDFLQVLSSLWGLKSVGLELATEPTYIQFAHLGRYGVDAQRLNLTADVNSSIVHRVAQVLAGMAQHDNAASLHHETRECTGTAPNDNGAALHVNSGPPAHITPTYQVASA